MIKVLLAFALIFPATGAVVTTPEPAAAAPVSAELLAKYGPSQRQRLERGIRQARSLWRDSDGDQAAFDAFVRDNFAGDQKTLDELFDRYERILEAVDGHMNGIAVELRRQSDLDLGPTLPVDDVLAGYDASAHLSDDWFANKAAFVVLLNFPATTLQERLSQGPHWTRRQWAEARLGERFSKRVPADVSLGIGQAAERGERYIAQYNVWMHHVLTPDGRRLFPAKLRLLSHWNLRDEIKAEYSEGTAALPKQRLIQAVMERIVTQTIPAAVIDNPGADWDPVANVVKASPKEELDGPARALAAEASAEPDTRYATLLGNFLANRKADPYSPAAPTLIARSFDEDREIPEARARAMLEKILSSSRVGETAALIRRRLGRPLEPFDLWYNGFRARGAYTEAQLDEIVRKRYPTADAYKKDIPQLLRGLGFAPDKADWIAERIVVEPARGSGHAWQPQMRSEPARLRTRVEKDGMNYKGFNIAVHEMGHNVEQVFSLYGVDHTLLRGVPNTAFTEALAFVFQSHDLELLGLAKPGPDGEALQTLDDFWGAYEIAGVSLVDMAAWHWMYDHPDATSAQLREAVIQASKDVWNRYYAPVFGRRDVVLLGIYSHMINDSLYLPNYPLGHMIAFQISERMREKGAVGPEFERMAKFGSLAPDLWMINATGKPVGPDALLAATARALKTIKK